MHRASVHAASFVWQPILSACHLHLPFERVGAPVKLCRHVRSVANTAFERILGTVVGGMTGFVVRCVGEVRHHVLLPKFPFYTPAHSKQPAACYHHSCLA